MKNFLFVAFLFILVGCGENGGVGSKKTATSPIVEKIIPEGATDLEQGRYIKTIEKDSLIYAGVVIPQGANPTEKIEILKPGERRKWARIQLAKHSPGRWLDHKVEHKDGFTIFIFRKATKEEEKEMDNLIESMRKNVSFINKILQNPSAQRLGFFISGNKNPTLSPFLQTFSSCHHLTYSSLLNYQHASPLHGQASYQQFLFYYHHEIQSHT